MCRDHPAAIPPPYIVNSPSRITPDLETLVRLFYGSPDELAHFELVDRADTPPVYARCCTMSTT